MARILIVEPKNGLAAEAKAALSPDGHEITVVDDAAEATAAVGTGAWDVILVSPADDSPDALKDAAVLAIQAISGAIPLCIVTEDPAAARKTPLVRIEAERDLRKPSYFRRLIAELVMKKQSLEHPAGGLSP